MQLQNEFTDLKKQQFSYVGFEEKFDTPPLKPTQPEPSFRKINSPPTKLLPPHLQVTNLLTVTAPRMEPSYTHSNYHKNVWGYKPKSQFTIVPLPDNYCDHICPPGWLSAFPAHLQTFKPTPASFTHTISQKLHLMS